MGMLIKWEDTCGRCIFAQVVSKNFAIIFFITAVAFPYAVAVSLYSILLFLALKMQKARYGGSYKISEEGRTSYFRLSFMSKKSSSSSKSSKTTSTRVSISSAGSGTSFSKAHRRRMRRQAMQEYKASLPGLDEKGDEVSAKLVRVDHKGNGDPEKGLNSSASVDMSKAVHPVGDEDSKPDQLIKDSDKSKDEGNGGHADNGSNNRRTVITIDSECKKSQGDEADFSPGNNSVTELDLKDTRSKLSKEITFADVNCENSPHTSENASESNNCTHEASAVPSVGENTKNQALPQGISTDEQEQELNTNKAIKASQKQLSSESSKSSRSLPSLTSTEEDETDEKSQWSLSKYFNRVVSDTKDKVLFLKKCQAVKTVLLIIGSFTVTYVPFVVGSLVYSLEKEKSKPLLHALQSILFCAIVANSLVNPLVYAYGYREFRLRTEKFKGIFATKKKPKL